MSNWFTGEVIVNGIQLHYTRTGGDKPPVLFAHGLTDNGLCWTPLVQLLESDYDCIMVDARGHGRSDVPDAGYTDADHASRLRRRDSGPWFGSTAYGRPFDGRGDQCFLGCPLS